MRKAAQERPQVSPLVSASERAVRLIQELDIQPLASADTPEKLGDHIYRAFGDAIKSTLAKLTPGELGEIVAEGNACAPRDTDARTTMATVHAASRVFCDDHWIGKYYSGEQILRHVAATVLIALMIDHFARGDEPGDNVVVRMPRH
ncbi:MAG: hypothetical protein KBE09_03265 [Candidatus Pacebacteria bacterium]|nr:hypothetical protein [Candidatus Paceibacterota bacterium]